AGRRTVVFDAYRKGEATSAAREPLLSQMRISQAIQ
ncbi:MAG TPA: pilus assembly protein CpaD, partial [Brevundimonas sp.]|nr:pilus assembly protein CpaD [Brevundimonas sp.]